MPIELSADAIELLRAASKSGELRAIRTFGGLSISAGGRIFETNDPRSEARWKSAIDELVSAGLVQDPTGKGHIFKVIHLGYQCVAALDEGSLTDQREPEPKRRIGFPLPHDRREGEARG